MLNHLEWLCRVIMLLQFVLAPWSTVVRSGAACPVRSCTVQDGFGIRDEARGLAELMDDIGC